MKNKLVRLIMAGLVGGFSMWVIAGLWHNLVLPMINKNVEAHHEGLLLMFFSYVILAFLMVYIYKLSQKGNKIVVDGFKIGAIIGILWVFPHGLAMAGIHNTSILYEIKNALWHIIEQGIGGIIIAVIIGKTKD